MSVFPIGYRNMGPILQAKILEKPTSKGFREMLRSPAVLIVMIICSTVLTLGLLGAIVWLTATEHGTEAIFTLITLFAVPVLGAMWANLTTMNQRLNGHTTRLMDAALKDKPKDEV